MRGAMDRQEHPPITAAVIEEKDESKIAKMSRKEKRKAMKKMKRKQVRKEIAIKEKEEEEARLNDPEELLRLARLHQEEDLRMERDRFEFQERERRFLQALELHHQQRQLAAQLLVNEDNANDDNEDDGWEYVEEGPAEIIWKGNEIIVKKKKVRVPKKPLDLHKEKQESERPISNPLAPQSEAYENRRNAQDVLESVAQQVPNFGTEQDKEHCPFHLKTGVCRFGTRCSRVHFYPDKACTLLLKNMYHGPGLAWEQDEGLEYTDEEAERSFEDFYEDVHTEFLKFGEIVNFKVCRNASSHLRGNVYVHYKSLESAMLAYQSINGRYFAGKQLTCEFVNVTRWRVAICGEYMKSKLMTCSRGSTCNFIHCFRNPCGDYEWADWDKPAPRYWLKSMAALFGYNGDRLTDEFSPGYHSRYSRSRGFSSPREDDGHRRRSRWRYRDDDRKVDNLAEVMQGRKYMHQDYQFIKHRKADGDISDGSSDGQRSSVGMRRSLKKRGREPDSIKQDCKSGRGDDFSAKIESIEGGSSNRYLGHDNTSSSRQKRVAKSAHEHWHKRDDKPEQGENIYPHKHHDRFNKHKDKYYLQEKKEADSSNVETHHDSLASGVDKHRRHNKKNLRRMKKESNLSSSASDESRSCRVKERSLKSRRKSSKLKNKISVAENGSDEDSLDRYKDRQHKCGKKYSTLASNISESSDGEDRLDKDEKRRRKSIRLKDKSVTDTESDRDEGRRHRHRKMHSRQGKHDADSSDSAFEGDRSIKYENRPQKSRITSSRSHKELDVTDFASNKKRSGEEERRRRHSSKKHHIKDFGSSKVDSDAFNLLRNGNLSEENGETGAGYFETDVRCQNSYADLDQNLPEQESTDDHGGFICRFSDTEKCSGSSDGDLVSGKDIKRFGNEHTLRINKSDAEAYVSAKVETFSASTSYQDFDAEAQAELEKACRRAALQKLEEIKRDKDTQGFYSREPVETSRMYSHEQAVAKGVDVSMVANESGSSKLETSVASVQRRRI